MKAGFFFEQKNHQRKSALIFLLFIVCILFIALFTSWSIYASLAVFIKVSFSQVFVWALVSIIGIVGGGAAWCQWRLTRQGALGLMKRLDAEPMWEPTTEFEQRYLNVVEEVSIAAGIPMPSTFLFETRNINAFSVGVSPEDTAICLTRGCLNTLNRRELEAVVAQAMSHIIDGSSKINFKAVGYVFGLSLVSKIGVKMILPLYDVRSGLMVILLPLAFLGFWVYLMGFVGNLSGQILQAWLCRTRIAFADATAVKITREKDTLAGALKYISKDSNAVVPVQTNHEVRHMFFCEAAYFFSERIFSTHPTIMSRIRKLDPGWNGRFSPIIKHDDRPLEGIYEDGIYTLKENARQITSEGPVDEYELKRSGGSAFQFMTFTNQDLLSAFNHSSEPDAEHLAYAKSLVAMLPMQLAQLMHTKQANGYLVLALLMTPGSECYPEKLKYIQEVYPMELRRIETAALALEQSRIQDVLSLFDLMVPSLRRLRRDQFDELLEHVNHIIRLDRRMALLEWSLHALLKHLYRVLFTKKRFGSFDQGKSFKLYHSSINVIVSSICHVSAMSLDRTQSALNKIGPYFNLTLKRIEWKQCAERLDDALSDCATLPEFKRKKLLSACIEIANYDHVLRIEESQVIRVVASGLGCPMPPLLKSQS